MRLNLKRSLMIMLFSIMLISLYGIGETIYDIKVLGARNIDPELVSSALSVRIGDVVDPETVAKSIRNLHRMGIFSDIQVHTEPLIPA